MLEGGEHARSNAVSVRTHGSDKVARALLHADGEDPGAVEGSAVETPVVLGP
jgi:hypothetical protein